MGSAPSRRVLVGTLGRGKARRSGDLDAAEPEHPEIAASEEEPDASHDLAPTEVRMSVLLVDDEPAVLDVMHQVLELGGFRVSTAANLTEAVEAGGSMAPTLVVTDLLLPDGTGMELVRHLRKTWPSLPAVLVSGANERDEFVTSAINTETVEFLQKPFTMTDLNTAVDRALGSR